MQPRAHGSRDSKALVLAALVSLGLTFLGDRETAEPEAPVAETSGSSVSSGSSGSSGLDGLLAASTARETGTHLLGDPTASARLSFAPEHDRLVWRVGTDDREVLLDAETGEALAFEFE
jgi:hypothetical protein